MKEVFQGFYCADNELTVAEGRTRWSFAVSSSIPRPLGLGRGLGSRLCCE